MNEVQSFGVKKIVGIEREKKKTSSKVLELVLCVETKTEIKTRKVENPLRISEAEAQKEKETWPSVNCVPIREKRIRDEM